MPQVHLHHSSHDMDILDMRIETIKNQGGVIAKSILVYMVYENTKFPDRVVVWNYFKSINGIPDIFGFGTIC